MAKKKKAKRAYKRKTKKGRTRQALKKARRKPPKPVRKVIEPKPTIYRDVEFKSRLEARWAVFFDYYHLMDGWQYEPKTFRLENGWEYTPDFFFQWSSFPGLLEVKPTIPSVEYLRGLFAFLPEMPIQLTLGIGDFYIGQPKLWVPGMSTLAGFDTMAEKDIKPEKVEKTIKAECLSMPVQWPDCETAIKTAGLYRFDITGKHPLPPFRAPGKKGPLDYAREMTGAASKRQIIKQRREAMKKLTK